VLKTGKPILAQEVHEKATPDTPGRAWLVNYCPVKSGGQIVGINAAVLEITDNKKIEGQLYQSQLMLRW